MAKLFLRTLDWQYVRRKLILSINFKVLGYLSLGAAIGAFIFAWVAAGEIYDYQDTVDGANLPGVDAIVCLAGGRGRIAFAGDLWYRYWEQTDPGAAVNPLPFGMDISQLAGFELPIRRGVIDVLTPKNVVLETESTNTEENAWLLTTQNEMAGPEFFSLLRYHMKRAEYLLQLCSRKVK